MPIQLPVPKDRALYLSAQVTQESINNLTKEIIAVNNADNELKKLSLVYGMTYTAEPIMLYIDSYGGNVYQCLGLLGVMENSLSPVHTIVTGCAMSCGFLIAITGKKRFAYKKSTFLYHQVSTGFFGKAKDMEADLFELKRLQDVIEKHTLSRTDLSKKQLKKCYDAKTDWIIPAKDALKYRIIDEILQ